MMNSKVHPDARELVNTYITQLPLPVKKICEKLRDIISSVSPNIHEDWKWSHPVYHCNGAICGLWASNDYVILIFFQGALIDDNYGVLSSKVNNLHNRYIKYTDVSDIREEIIRDYLLQSINYNTRGVKINQTKMKNIDIPYYIKDALENAGLLESFNNMSYSHKKEYIMWIKEAKKESTREKRIEQMILKLREKFGLSSL